MREHSLDAVAGLRGAEGEEPDDRHGGLVREFRAAEGADDGGAGVELVAPEPGSGQYERRDGEVMDGGLLVGGEHVGPVW